MLLFHLPLCSIISWQILVIVSSCAVHSRRAAVAAVAAAYLTVYEWSINSRGLRYRSPLISTAQFYRAILV